MQARPTMLYIIHLVTLRRHYHIRKASINFHTHLSMDPAGRALTGQDVSESILLPVDEQAPTIGRVRALLLVAL